MRVVMTLREEKQALRKAIRGQIAQFPAGYLTEAGACIAKQLAACPEYQKADTVMAFVSTATEPDMFPFLRQVLSDGKRLALPLCTGSGIMEARLVTDLSQLRPGSYNIPEPTEECPLLQSDMLQLVIVPCMACDSAGNRLGHGGGFYDRYLEAYEGATLLVCPERLLQPHIPMEPLDKKISVVVTEYAIYRSNQ